MCEVILLKGVGGAGQVDMHNSVRQCQPDEEGDFLIQGGVEVRTRFIRMVD